MNGGSAAVPLRSIPSLASSLLCEQQPERRSPTVDASRGWVCVDTSKVYYALIPRPGLFGIGLLVSFHPLLYLLFYSAVMIPELSFFVKLKLNSCSNFSWSMIAAVWIGRNMPGRPAHGALRDISGSAPKGQNGSAQGPSRDEIAPQGASMGLTFWPKREIEGK